MQLPSARTAIFTSVIALSALACSSSERETLGPSGRGGGSASGTPGEIVTTPGTNGARPEVKPEDCGQNVDIVFVMDVSTSMDAFLNKLNQEMEAVDQSIKSIAPMASPYYGLAVFVDDAMLLNSGKPFQNVSALRGEFKKWANFTSWNQQLQSQESNTTWPENSLDALFAAASSFSWRPGSLRIAIHTTDDTFWNGPTSENGVSIQHNYQDTLQKLLSQQIRVFSYAAKYGGPDENQDVSAGWFGPYGGADAIPKATGGGVFELDQVVSGQTSLAQSITGIVKDTLCKPYPVVK
jgi:hypothetical protein